MADAGVRLLAYDPLWPMMFEAEAERIEAACAGLAIRLEHIGSTSVPGMSAKPIIDILAGRPPQSRAAPPALGCAYSTIAPTASWTPSVRTG